MGSVGINEIDFSFRHLRRLKQAIMHIKQAERDLSTGSDLESGKFIFKSDFKRFVEVVPERGSGLESTRKPLLQEGSLFAPGFVKLEQTGAPESEGMTEEDYFIREVIRNGVESSPSGRLRGPKSADTNDYVAKIDFSVDRAMEILDILRCVSKSDILKDSLPRDIKESLACLSFEELVFETRNEHLLKRLVLRMVDLEGGAQETL